jgi:hypothetical protein
MERLRRRLRKHLLTRVRRCRGYLYERWNDRRRNRLQHNMLGGFLTSLRRYSEAATLSLEWYAEQLAYPFQYRPIRGMRDNPPSHIRTGALQLHLVPRSRSRTSAACYGRYKRQGVFPREIHYV